MSSAEKAQYDQDVDVYFQTSAWMDSQLNQEWVKRTLIPEIGTSPQENVIFAVLDFNKRRAFMKCAERRSIPSFICSQKIICFPNPAYIG